MAYTRERSVCSAAPRRGLNLFRSVAEIAEAIGRDSTMTMALVFTRIANNGSEGMLQATVQRELGISPAVLTRAVQTLSGLGLISRSIDSADGRHHVLRLTEKGHAVLSAVPRATSAVL
jgi:DNA-binding MarR family transcriptional regulator